ncbi:MAG TPA: acyltransferase [Caulobacteraceae bacterium]|nr:acyltransferase [Caulobacteraceae bacterium]
MSQNKLFNIEALRGLASLAVCWFHVTSTHSVAWVKASGAYGWLGVDCFFVISGFVIPYALFRSDYSIGGFPRFMLRRLVRLEPPYLVSIALIVALAYLSAITPGFRGAPPHFTVPQLASHLLYVAPYFHQEWVNIVYWTLAFEFAFYVAAGLSFPFLYKRGLWLTALLVAAAALLVPSQTSFLEGRVLLFLIGIASMRYFVGRDSLAIYLTCLAGTAGLMVAAGSVPSAIAGVTTGLVITMIKLPRVRLLSGLGALSYSLYLIHVPIGGRVVNLGHRFGQGAAFELFLSLLAVAVCLLVAFVLYRFVEAPATALAQKLSLRPPPNGAPAAEAAGA